MEAHRSCHRRICIALPIFLPSQDLYRPTDFPVIAGFEFASMRERAKKLNGTLDIDAVFMAFFFLEWIDFVSSFSTVAGVNGQLTKAACIGRESCCSASQLQSRFFQQKSGYLCGGQATGGFGIGDDNRWRSIRVDALLKF